MKKIISLLLIIAALFSVTSCSEDFYEPVESTEEEARIVLTFSYGGKSYGVRYELYRALFLTYKSDVDGGNPAVWSGPDKDTYIAKIQERIINRAADIYSTFALASELGINPYSGKVDEQVNEYVNMSVDGGDYLGVHYDGYQDYDAFLAALKAKSLNYSVATLMFRWSIVSDMIDEYYIGSRTEEGLSVGIDATEGHIDFTREDVEAFYYSEETVRLLRTFVSEEMEHTPEALAGVLDSIAAKIPKGDEAVRKAMISNGSLIAATELEEGYVMGKYNLERAYAEMVELAFTLKVGEIGGPVEIYDDNEDEFRYYILYRIDKSSTHFEKNYNSIAYIYLRNEVGKEYKRVSDELIRSVTPTDVLASLDHASIAMD